MPSIAARTALRSAASSRRVELTNTRIRWSGVRITGLSSTVLIPASGSSCHGAIGLGAEAPCVAYCAASNAPSSNPSASPAASSAAASVERSSSRKRT